jgi:hypothetical protein
MVHGSRPAAADGTGASHQIFKRIPILRRHIS